MVSENVIHCVQNVHVKEFVKLINWSVKIRWYYIIISSLIILLVYLNFASHGFILNYQYFIIANVFLFFCNLFYQYQLRKNYKKCLGTPELRYYLILQIMTDYLALTLFVYALGSIETPIILMIIPNMILATLFFTPRQSLLITLSGMALLISPLLFEYLHIIPVISIFEDSFQNSFKVIVLSHPQIILGYIFLLFSCALFGWYLLCRITTRLIQNELYLERSYEDMLKLDKEKTHATLRSTHELKAPLAAIKNYIYTINAGYTGEVNDKVLKIINRIGKRCDYLLNNVTDIIKLGNLKSYVISENNFYAVNLASFIDTFVAQNKELVLKKRLTIKIDNQLTCKQSIIMADKENLQLIFSNIFNNAVNYSFDNGTIDIKLNEQEKMLCVSIKDRGIGIEEQLIDKVFDEHFRTSNAANYYEGGTGLGLSIVKVCCEILDAQINLISSPAQGTTVRICFHAHH